MPDLLYVPNIWVTPPTIADTVNVQAKYFGSLPSPSCFPSGLLLLPFFPPPYRSKMGLSKPRCVHLLQLCKYPPAAGCTHLKSAVCAWQVDRRYVGGVWAFFFLAKQTEYIVSLYEFSWNPYLQNPCIARNGVMTSLFTQVYQTLVPY